MKLMFASDIHGSALYCRQMLDAFAREGAESLILLGDLLYHGPRNDLPDGYAPKEVITLLNDVSDRLLCVRGNCDTEVDQMVLNFPILADYAILYLDGHRVYLTHGHHFGEDNPPKLRDGDILINGHTHVPACRDKGGYLYLNPGSVSIPKENSVHGYMTFENGIFTWKDLDGNVVSEHKI
ncbi:MAG: phosphodiesterase [Clostridia bacterium]|nr:phosphodiesterase [Clostridia bacterium]